MLSQKIYQKESLTRKNSLLTGTPCAFLRNKVDKSSNTFREPSGHCDHNNLTFSENRNRISASLSQ